MRIVIISWLLVAVALAAGCAHVHDDSTGTVAGTLRFQGRTLASGTRVVFVNLQTGFTCYGETAPDGSYQLASRNHGRIPVGAFAAMIRPPEPLPEPPSAPEALGDAAAMRRRPDLAFEFPDKYAELATSELVFDVQPGPNEIYIELRAD